MSASKDYNNHGYPFQITRSNSTDRSTFDKSDYRNESPPSSVFQNHRNEALMEAIKKDDIDTVEQLLNEPGIDIKLLHCTDAYARKMTGLICAIRNGNYDMVELLFIQYW